MYGGVLLLCGVVLVLLSPAIWVVWWLLADLGEKVSGSALEAHESWSERAPRAA